MGGGKGGGGSRGSEMNHAYKKTRIKDEDYILGNHTTNISTNPRTNFRQASCDANQRYLHKDGNNYNLRKPLTKDTRRLLE